MKKTILTIICCIILIISIVVINLLNIFPTEVYATNISIEKDSFTTVINDSISFSDYNLLIFPKDYNQGVSFSSTNSNIASVDKNGNINCKNYGSATITISVKSNKEENITKTIDLIINDNTKLATLSHDVVLFDVSNSYCNNLLTYYDEQIIEVTTKNNIVLYDYTKTVNNITIKEEYKNKLFYDKVNILVTNSNGYKQQLIFEVHAIKTLNVTNTNKIILEFSNFVEIGEYLNVDVLTYNTIFKNYEDYFYYNCDYDNIKIYPLKSYFETINLKLFCKDFVYYININLNL